jgi:hypothetical protein
MVMTMQRVAIPSSLLDSEIGGGGRFVFPPTAYRGVISEVRVSSPNMAEIWSGYTSDDVDQVSLQMGDIEALEGFGQKDADEITEEIGDRTFFIQFTIRDGDLDFSNVDITDRKSPNWQLQRGLRLFGMVARALGAGEQTENGFVPDFELLDDLLKGEGISPVRGNSLGFTVTHSKNKKDPESPYQNIGKVFTA